MADPAAATARPRAARRAGLSFAPCDEDDAFWTDTAHDLLERAGAQLGDEAKFDALVCDEGQDFRTLWWLSLASVMRTPDHPWFVFYDPKQTLSVEKPGIPEELGVSFRLQYDCRNTRAITARCAEILGAPMAHHPDAPAGIPRASSRRRTGPT